MGIEFRESSYVLNAKASPAVVFKPGMVFNLSVGFGNCEPKKGKGDRYSLHIADTILLTEDSDPGTSRPLSSSPLCLPSLSPSSPPLCLAYSTITITDDSLVCLSL